MPTFKAYVYLHQAEENGSIVETSEDIVFEAESLLDAVKATKRYADRRLTLFPDEYIRFSCLKIKEIKNSIDKQGYIVTTTTPEGSAEWKYDRETFQEFIDRLEYQKYNWEKYRAGLS